MPIVTSQKGLSLQGILVTVFAAILVIGSPRPTLAVSVNDAMNIPQDPLAIGLQPQTSRKDAVNSTLRHAEYRLKQGAWQEAAQQAEQVLAKDKENVKAHAILDVPGFKVDDAAFAGIAMLVLAYLSDGSLGDLRLAHLGPSPMTVAILTTVLLTLGAVPSAVIVSPPSGPALTVAESESLPVEAEDV